MFAYGSRRRAAKLDFALRSARSRGARTILVVGVHARATPTTNQIEQGLLAEYPNLVACGIESGPAIWPRYVRCDGRRLPFDDGVFDLVYSNAVVEHVGSEADQRRFLAEHARVGRAWIATTPNRFFPIEPHFHGLFTHWKRSWNVEGIRLLSRSELLDISPPGTEVLESSLAPTFTAVGTSRPTTAASLP